MSWMHSSTNAKGQSSNELYGIKTGGFKITLAKRFTPGGRWKKTMDPIVEKIP